MDSVWKQTGKKPVALEEPACPYYLSHVVDWWYEIRCGLAVNGMAIPNLTWDALHSWCEFRKIRLRKAEVTLLFHIENVYHEEQARKAKGNDGATSGS